jgi:hypothetical protein
MSVAEAAAGQGRAIDHSILVRHQPQVQTLRSTSGDQNSMDDPAGNGIEVIGPA